MREGALALGEGIGIANGETVVSTRVSDLLIPVPSIGPKTCRMLMERAVIRPSRRVRGLGCVQKKKLSRLLETLGK